MQPFFKNKFQEILFIGVSLLAFIAFYIETDIYTPSFPEMMTYFGTDEDAIQLLLSMNFLGLCISSLFFGPASDAFGRKTILSSGLGIFTLGSLGCAFADSLSWMIVFRFLQGVGCGSIVSAGCASFFDIYPPAQSSRLVAILNGAVGGMMALAPILGNWISLNIGWRANFYLIAILASLAFISNLMFIKETLPADKRNKLSFSNVFRNYKQLLANFPFLAHTIIWCLMFSVVIVFIANLSLIFVDYLQVSQEVFGYYQTAIMGTFFVGSMSGAYLISKLGMVATKISGSLIYAMGILFLCVLAYFGINSPMLLIIAMSLASLGSALSMTIYFTFSMTHISEDLKGSALSLTQSLRLLMSSCLVWLAANQFDGSIKPMTLLAIYSTLICVLIYALLYRKDLHLAPSTQEPTVSL